MIAGMKYLLTLPHIAERQRKIEMLEEDLAREKEALLRDISEARRLCPHERMKGRFDYSYGGEKMCPHEEGETHPVYLGRRCLDCGHMVQRRPGSPIEVCFACGGDMRMEGAPRKAVCVLCGHAVSLR